MPYLRVQAGFEPTFADCESGTLATRLTQPHIRIFPNVTQHVTLSIAYIASGFCILLKGCALMSQISSVVVDIVKGPLTLKGYMLLR